MIPLLSLMGVPIHTAVGTCLAFVACSSLAGILQHVRQRSIDPVVVLTMTLPATLMAIVSAHFASLVSRPVLHVLFSLLLTGVMVMYSLAPTRAVSAYKANDLCHGIAVVCHTAPA